MTYTNEQYEQLKNAIANGVQSVVYGDKNVTYRSIAEMKEVLRTMEVELFPSRKRRRRGYFCTGRGYFSKK